jgi:hypothetical protein
MLLVFTTATVAAGRTARCQCFGSAGAASSGGTAAFLSRNGALVAAGLLVGLAPGAGADAEAWVAAAGVGTVLGAVIAGWDELGYLLGRSARLG